MARASSWTQRVFSISPIPRSILKRRSCGRDSFSRTLRRREAAAAGVPSQPDFVLLSFHVRGGGIRRCRMPRNQPPRQKSLGKPQMSSTKTQTGAALVQTGPCWNCKAAVGGGHFCVACGKIQPLVGDADYFAFFGLPQKLKIDEAELEQRFHQLSWKLHPDNFVKASEFERNLALERSSELNDAYRTLREPVLRVEYL